MKLYKKYSASAALFRQLRVEVMEPTKKSPILENEIFAREINIAPFFERDSY